MKNLLYLSYDFPYPLDAGGKIRSYHLIKQLSKEYRVRLLYYYRGERPKSYEQKLTNVVTTIHAFKRRPFYSFQNLFYTVNYPFPIALYYDPLVKKIIDQEVDSGIDAIHYESFYTSCFVQHKSPALQVLGTENIEWQVYGEYTRNEKNPVK